MNVTSDQVWAFVIPLSINPVSPGTTENPRPIRGPLEADADQSWGEMTRHVRRMSGGCRMYS